MPGRKSRQNALSNFVNRKIQFQDLHVKTVEVTMHALRWIFLVIFLFIAVGIFVLFVTGGENYLQAIIGYSITGFFTFFMGYFGWILAQGIIEMITGKEPNEDKTFSYYFSRSTRKRKFK